MGAQLSTKCRKLSRCRQVGDTEPRAEAEKVLELLKRFGWEERVYLSGIDQFLPSLNSLTPAFDQKPEVFKFEPGELQAFERGKRLGSPSHWRGYFAFDVPSYAIRDADVSAFRKATQSDPKAAIRILTRLIEKVHERPGHFLDLLLDRLPPVPMRSGTPVSGNLEYR